MGQGVVYLVSIGQITYLTSIFSPGSYGVLAFGQTLAALSMVWTSYAVNNTGVAAITAATTLGCRTRILWQHLAAQVLLLGAAWLVLALSLLFSPLRNDWPIYAIVGVSMLGQVLWPGWVMTALEQFRIVSLITTCTRILSFVALAVVVHDNSQIFAASLCLFLPSLIPIPVGIAVLFLSGKLSWQRPTMAGGMAILKRDFGLAASNWLMFFCSAFPIFFAKFILSPAGFGLYAFADRFRALAATFIGLIAMVLYSRFCKHLADERELPRFGRLALTGILVVSIAITTAIIAGAEIIVDILGSAAFQAGTTPLRILALTIPIAAFNYYVGYFIIATYRLVRQQVAGLAVSIAIGMVVMYLVPIQSALGIASIVLAFECLRATISVLTLQYYQLNLFSLTPPSVSRPEPLVKDKM
jgi:O-antigen/teichoic acid export membrane protein